MPARFLSPGRVGILRCLLLLSPLVVGERRLVGLLRLVKVDPGPARFGVTI